MAPDLRAFFQKVTKGSMSGNAGQQAKEDFKINGQYVDTPERASSEFPFLMGTWRRHHSIILIVRQKQGAILMSINFMKVHQRTCRTRTTSISRCLRANTADSVHELDARIGRIMDKIRALGLDKNTIVFYTTDNGAWQDVYPDAGYTPFRGTRAPCARAAAAFPRSPGCLERSRRE